MILTWFKVRWSININFVIANYIIDVKENNMGIFDFLKKKKVESSVKIDISVKSPDIESSTEVFEPISLEILLADAIPSKQGLYPHEILMLEYAPTFKISNNYFQQFWYYQYSVKNPQAVLDSLYEKGFIAEGDLKDALEKLKVSEIKEELKHINQKVTGKKAELIDRLMVNADIDYLNRKYSERYFVCTFKGEQELKDNQYVSYLHRKKYMSVWEMNKKIADTHYPYRDILWGYFNEQSGIQFQNYDFGLYRNTRLNMYQFLMEENKPKTAFSLLCEVLSFDLSGLGNSEKYLFESERTDPKFYLMMYDSKSKHYFPYENTSLIIPPAVLGWFVEVQDILGLDDDEFKVALLEELGKVNPPQKIFTDEECADILIATIHEDVDILSEIYSKAEKRENKRIKEIKSKIR